MKEIYRILAENKEFEIFRTISVNYIDIWKQKADNSNELSALVEDRIKLSNDFVEDFNRIINFIKN